MDEPFGALDEQTRMILGEDLSVLLSRADKTIVFVTHSLGEAVFLADRVAVFSARPGTIKEIIERRRAASAQAELRHHREVQQAPQHALRPAARRDPQGRGAVRHGGAAVVSARRERARQAAQPRRAGRLSGRAGRCSGISARPIGASAICCCPIRSRSGHELKDVLGTGEFWPDLKVTLTELAIAFCDLLHQPASRSAI